MLVLSRLGRKAEAELERLKVERLKGENDRFTQITRCSCEIRSIPSCAVRLRAG